MKRFELHLFQKFHVSEDSGSKSFNPRLQKYVIFLFSPEQMVIDLFLLFCFLSRMIIQDQRLSKWRDVSSDFQNVIQKSKNVFLNNKRSSFAVVPYPPYKVHTTRRVIKITVILQQYFSIVDIICLLFAFFISDPWRQILVYMSET